MISIFLEPEITIKLVLNDVVEDFQQKENQMMIGWSREQKPWRTERFEQVQ